MTWRYALAVEADPGGEHVWTIREIHTATIAAARTRALGTDPTGA